MFRNQMPGFSKKPGISDPDVVPSSLERIFAIE